ncbi:MAG TPA: NUMOD4 domain-containing protein [Trebonia sp.]|nr:NUMOD4 domain-containing protein [Trebonia sp.]
MAPSNSNPIGKLERWKPVPGHEGAYEVSDLGRVRSLERWVTYRDGRGRRQRGRVLKLLADGNGYLRVNMAGVTRHVHILVLEAFDQPRPAGMEACHGPGGKTDNRLSNLRWATRSENLGADKHRDGTMAYAKLDVARVLACLARHAGGESYAAIAADYNVTKVTVWNVVNGRSWRHLTRLAPRGLDDRPGRTRSKRLFSWMA